MRLLGPTPIPRLNEAGGVVFLFSSIFLTLSLVSYHPSDLSWNTATGAAAPENLTGSIGSHLADLLLQGLGLSSFLLPFFLVVLGWKWIRSQPLGSQFARFAGALLLIMCICTALALAPDFRLFGDSIRAGGLVGMLLADALISVLNLAGTLLIIAALFILSLYLVSSFSLFRVPDRVTQSVEFGSQIRAWWASLLEKRRARRLAREDDEDDDEEEEQPASENDLRARARRRAERMKRSLDLHEPPPPETEPLITSAAGDTESAPWDSPPGEPAIPIQTQADAPPPPSLDPETVAEAERYDARSRRRLANPYSPPAVFEQADFRLPPTDMLTEPSARNPYDELELKETAVTIKSKFEEFNVFGSVVQINHGPVVTTFEYKPDAGIKYSRITTLSDDLCLGLRAESILIQRIPGKPTIGIEVPNTKREVIRLRQVLESDEFTSSKSKIPIPLGKDINGRIQVAALESMPHLLIAGSTGSGKSVMLNSLLMAMLFRATPDEVRMVLVDPKRVELGMYEGIPHLLTPVITDPRKATNALRNAVLEMERRLKLLASQGVRNIAQYNRKIKKLLEQPRSLFPEQDEIGEELETLPYILIVIDELADLMMIEKANVEAAVTRLAQMARAVGMHLVLATQRPSVDVITGLIKANFPARISFRVATRVDSRTILDVMGSEHLLGKGDMLFLPPGSGRLNRVHGAYVTEDEITEVVDFWKQQAAPEYDETLLMAPPGDDEALGEDADPMDNNDPLYEDAIRVVIEMGKASTSILQRRLRIGYGRAARLLDIMQHEGIIGPPDGSRPREVLKAPEWLTEVEHRIP